MTEKLNELLAAGFMVKFYGPIQPSAAGRILCGIERQRKFNVADEPIYKAGYADTAEDAFNEAVERLKSVNTEFRQPKKNYW